MKGVALYTELLGHFQKSFLLNTVLPLHSILHVNNLGGRWESNPVQSNHNRNSEENCCKTSYRQLNNLKHIYFKFCLSFIFISVVSFLFTQVTTTWSSCSFPTLCKRFIIDLSPIYITICTTSYMEFKSSNILQD